MSTITTFDQVQKANINDLKAVYDKLTGGNIKFDNIDTARKRTWAVLEPAVKKANGEKAKRRMGFRLSPADTVKPIRPGSKRHTVFQLMSSPKGTTFYTIMETCGWTKRDAYEGVRLVNITAGYGIWGDYQEDGDVTLKIVTKEEYEKLLKASKLN